MTFQAFSPECRHLNIESEEKFVFLLCQIAIFGGFTYLHGLRWQSASLKLGITLPIAFFVVKSYTGMWRRGIVPQQRPGCPTEAEKTEENDAAQHSQHTAWFPAILVPCGNTKVRNHITWRMDKKKIKILTSLNLKSSFMRQNKNSVARPTSSKSALRTNSLRFPWL